MNTTIDLTAPRNYTEMNEKQIRYVANLQVKGTPEEWIWTKCLIRFTGITAIGGNKALDHEEIYYFAKKHLKGFFSLTIEEVYSFSQKLSFLTKTYVGIRPMAKIGKYRSCDELLRDTIFLQYLDAENYYQAFIFTKAEIHLHRMMATLFRIPGKPYSNELTEKHIKRMARCSAVEKLIAVMWMIGVKEYYSSKFKSLFERIKDDEDIITTAPDMYGIIQNQIRMLTEGDITKRDQVLNSNTWDALDEMNEKARESKEMERRNNNP